ncbi:SDR family oxidoreductase [Alteraurantiacibacter aquimixticola]|uniref:SDR family NAD(P)-dependent oxidoreductase n=1 Tax=Alteraurantiacibacter aquimixticola TaxID=2489173 RepID=A0A4T3EWH9_9SPHN|nr:SDR family oxidoreductase [Alteraurantiacibacter aquimixticola]TIX48823.1 SDR family NAD(P)-dependent oxidoreductase [Alteraurantiacibacter aquimixticola]
MKILILGGYGVFGGRLARLLSDMPQATLLLAGRSEAKARQFCSVFTGVARVEPVGLDRRDIADALARLQPDLVVDASGPFQDYGADQYRVVESCLAQKVHYLDFADGADFVFGISRFDEAARQAGICILSGVSSFPVLTAAVLRELSRTMEIVEVEGGIAPSPYAGIGLNVMRAVVGYAGAPVKLTRAGRVGHGIGLAESRRYTIAVPGRMPLRNIRFSLVDVPDLQVLPPEHPAMTDIWMGAGPVPEALHRMLNLLAKARHLLHLPSPEPFSRLFYAVLNLMKFGEHRGGMYVHAKGTRDGEPVERSWHLLAEADDGPLIPSMAIEGIIRKALAGNWPEPGARPATHALELDDYGRLFAGRTIHSGFRDHVPHGPIYRCILGSAFDGLPEKVRELHDDVAERSWAGTASVKRGSGLLAGVIAMVFGFPKSGDPVPVSVTFSPEGGGERWTRTFGDHSFSSHQSCGVGRSSHLLVERFGIVEFGLALVVEDERLHLVPRRGSILGIPLPKFLLPRGRSFECQRDGMFCFDVEIVLRVVGLVVHYQGRLSRV